MSVFDIVLDLEKEIDEHNFNVDEKIACIRDTLVPDNEYQISSRDAKLLAIRIWDISNKLRKLIPNTNDLDKSKLQYSLIPELKLLATDIYQKYGDQNNEDDLCNLFCFYSYTYESLLDSDNISLATSFLDKAFETFPQLKYSSDMAKILVQLKIWQVRYIIVHSKDYDEALNIIKEFIDQYMIESPLLISFIYKTAVEIKSIDWCHYCLSLAYSYSTISDECKNQIESLLAQLYINNDDPEQAMKIVSILPLSINKLFLEIKCIILLSPEEEDLKEKMISFIQETTEDRRILVALSLFVAEHCESIQNVSILFITEVMRISHTIYDNFHRNIIYTCAIQISCNLNDTESTFLFVKMIKADNILIEQHRNEIASTIWNKAVDTFDANQFEKAVQWMELSRSLMSDLDNEAQSCFYRFIICCFYEAKNYKEALKYVEILTKKIPNCSYGHLLNFQIQIAQENQKEAFDIVESLISNSPNLEYFEPEFFFSVAAELYSIGNINLALDTLLKFFELNFNSQQNLASLNIIKKRTITSIFALLQEVDETFVSKSINKLSSHWKNQIEYKIIENEEKEMDENEKDNDSLLFFTRNEIYSFVSVAFNNGLKLKEENLWEEAANSFMFGFFLSDSLIDIKASCLFEAVDCCLCEFGSNCSPDSPTEFFKGKLEEISPEIENLEEEKIKDDFFLAKVKILIVTINQSDSEKDSLIANLIEMIEAIKSPKIFYEICSLVCKYKVSYSIIQPLLENAKKIDQMPSEILKKEGDITSLSASILHIIYSNLTTTDDFSQFYDIFIEFISHEDSSLISSSHLQLFMSHAWNLGVNCVESFQLKEAESWFSKAVEIMEMNEELKNLYSKELHENYSNFLAYKGSN